MRDWMDKERAAKIAGSRFAYIKGGLVRLQFALMTYGLDVLTDEEIRQTTDGQANLHEVPSHLHLYFTRCCSTAVYDATGRLDSEPVMIV